MGPSQSINGCCGEWPRSNWGAAIGIPCNFRPKCECSNSSQNNMGSLWQPPDWTWISHHNIHFLIAHDPYEYNLERKSIFFAELLELKSGAPGRRTIKPTGVAPPITSRGGKMSSASKSMSLQKCYTLFFVQIWLVFANFGLIMLKKNVQDRRCKLS